MPTYDPDGNLVRGMILVLLFVQVCLTVIFTDPAMRLGAYSNLVNVYFFLIPAVGSGYALYHFNRRRINRPSMMKGNSLGVFLRSAGEFLSETPYAGVVFWIAIGVLGWGMGNLYWAFLQNVITRDLLNAPPIWMGYDLLYLALPVGWLLGMASLYRVNSLSLEKVFAAHKGFVLAIVGGSTLIALVIALIVRQGCLCDPEDPLAFVVTLFYGAVDGLVLATIVLLPRTLAMNLWSESMRLGLKVMGVGWWIFVLADQLLELGFRLPDTSFLNFHVGSIYDLLGITGVTTMCLGLSFMVYATLIEHPHISFFSEKHRELTRLLVRGLTTKEIASEWKTNNTVVERRITELYRVTGFDTAERHNKRSDFVAYYRSQVADFFPPRI